MGQLSDRQKKDIKGLARRKNRKKQNAFLVEGIRSVDGAIEASGIGRANIRLLISTPEAQNNYRDRRAAEQGADVAVVSAKELAKLSTVDNPQGVMLVASIPSSNADDMQNKKCVLILDAIQDPGNVGTLMRTAAWFGVEGVLIGPGSADPFSPKVARASMGGIWDVAVAESDNLSAWCQQWTESTKPLYAADMNGVDSTEWSPEFPSALLVGSEAHGISEGLQPFISARLHIPSGSGKRVTESLNVSVAGGLVMANWVRAKP